jgi:hypothetical protein
MALTPLATFDDLEVRIEGGIPDSDAGRADAMLIDASAKIRRATRQTISVATTTATLRTVDRRITLPERPVTAVSAVTDLYNVAVTFAWDGLQVVDFTGWYDVVGNAPEWTATRRPNFPLKVTYTHGYAEIPDDIIAICCASAARGLGSSLTDGNVRSESIDGYAQTLSADPLELLPSELEVLKDYRARSLRSIRMR